MDDIGATSLMTAQLRAQEAERADRIVEDRWAAEFVAAAGGALPPGAEGFVEQMREQVAVRTRFLDDALLAATRAGCAQVVLLAAGMDSRAFRLDWPAGTTVFEVDQAGVLAFKDTVAGERGATARCERRAVAADLRENWTAELGAAGFDPARPTAWLVEGLLYSLDAAEVGRIARAHHRRERADERSRVRPHRVRTESRPRPRRHRPRARSPVEERSGRSRHLAA